jgi:hypothetical protein
MAWRAHGPGFYEKPIWPSPWARAHGPTIATTALPWGNELAEPSILFWAVRLIQLCERQTLSREHKVASAV